MLRSVLEACQSSGVLTRRPELSTRGSGVGGLARTIVAPRAAASVTLETAVGMSREAFELREKRGRRQHPLCIETFIWQGNTSIGW